MAENKHTGVKAAIFKTNMKTNYEVDMTKIDKKFSKLVSRELKFCQSPPNSYHKSMNPEDIRSRRKMKPSRMLIYEDCSDEEEPFRSTPPNIQDRCIETPGAPMKSRKEFDKKVLRPKKLVYNDKENDTEDLRTENHFYHSTPKNTAREDENDDFYYEKMMNMTAIIPRKIFPIRADDESLFVYSNNQEFSAASKRESKNVQQDRNRTRFKGGSRKKKLNNETRKTSNRSTSLKNDLSCNKENNAAGQFGVENDLRAAEIHAESSKNRSIKNSDRNREEFMNLSKIRELNYFRI